MTEGFIPPPPKVGASHTLQIPVNNVDNYIDLQYRDHDLEGVAQVLQLKTLKTLWQSINIKPLKKD